MEFKKDPFVIGLAAVVVVALAVLLQQSKIDWPQFLAGVVLLGIPSLFGRSKDVTP